MTEREKGVQTVSCPSCGTDLNPVEQPDGATAYETCPSCYPAKQSEPEKASRKSRRETGTDVEASSTREEGQ